MNSLPSTARRHLPLGGRAASAVAAVLIAAAPGVAQAQSAQSLLDRVAQLQTSLNIAVADIKTSLSAISYKLDTVLGKLAAPASPATLTTGALLRPPGHAATCLAVNVGSAPGSVTTRIFNTATGLQLDTSTAPIQPNQSGGTGYILAPEQLVAVSCRFEPAAGMQLRAGLSITELVTNRTIAYIEAR